MESPTAENEDETAEEKIARLKEEITKLNESAEGVPELSALWFTAKKVIGAKDTELQLLFEEQRASEVLKEYFRAHPTVQESVEDCPICCEPCWNQDETFRFVQCCFKWICKECRRKGGADLNVCPFCRKTADYLGWEYVVSVVSSLADEGMPWARAEKARMLRDGDVGIERDPEKSETLFRSLVEGEDLFARRDALIGLSSINSLRGEYDEALRLQEYAASLGDMRAVGYLAEMFLQRHAIPSDADADVTAVNLATVSATLQTRNTVASKVLGNYFWKGKGGLTHSPVLAKHYLRYSAESGDRWSMFSYATVIIEAAIGCYGCLSLRPGFSAVPEALFWYRLAIGEDSDSGAFKRLEEKIRDCCGNCHEKLNKDKLLCCVECKAAFFCGKHCQRAHWNAGHKRDCVKSLKKRLKATEDSLMMACSGVLEVARSYGVEPTNRNKRP
mmetsp:Transcript_9461/g.20279  ORF Transcript_9461/g.20279 Transcript_9461/m.20279 type:complete len:446 (-) Transcript_9461:874-2211(-)